MRENEASSISRQTLRASKALSEHRHKICKTRPQRSRDSYLALHHRKRSNMRSIRELSRYQAAKCRLTGTIHSTEQIIKFSTQKIGYQNYFNRKMGFSIITLQMLKSRGGHLLLPWCSRSSKMYTSSSFDQNGFQRSANTPENTMISIKAFFSENAALSAQRRFRGGGQNIAVQNSTRILSSF